MKILVVDDDRSTRMLLKAFLLRSGHQVIEAEDGQEAVSTFEREWPDLILMDVWMPSMTGYEAASAIKKSQGSQFIPIIFLTSMSDDASLAACVESGGDDFLVKPFNSVILAAKIVAMQRIIHLQEELRQYRERTEQEIALTHHIFAALTKRTRQQSQEIDCWMESAGHFSGDLFISNVSPDGKSYVLLGDFTGHGFHAALGSVPIADVFFAMTEKGFVLKEILNEMNRKLKAVLPVGNFCAACIVCIDHKKNCIEVFNGGMPPLILLDSSNHVIGHVPSSNIAIGIGTDQGINLHVLQGSDEIPAKLLIYSDGVLEATNAQGTMFGEVGLETAIHATAGGSLLDQIKTSLNNFLGNKPPEDDISVIAVNCKTHLT